MTIYLLTFFILVLVVTGMSVGVIFSNKPIKGSCGGLNAIGIDGTCEICGGDTQKCEEEQERRAHEEESAKAPMFYDASKQ